MLTSGQSNLTLDRIAATDGRLNSIRQVVPTCLPMWARWRHLANTIEPVLPSAHPSPQSKRHLDCFSRVCIDNYRVSLYFTIRRPPPQKSKLSLPMGRSGPPYNTWLPGPTHVLSPNDMSICSAIFAGFTSVTD